MSNTSKDIIVSIGDIRKQISKKPQEWALIMICDKLEEIEQKLNKIEQNYMSREETFYLD